MSFRTSPLTLQAPHCAYILTVDLSRALYSSMTLTNEWMDSLKNQLSGGFVSYMMFIFVCNNSKMSASLKETLGTCSESTNVVLYNDIVYKIAMCTLLFIPQVRERCHHSYF